jgi:hypothetical protein
MKIASQSSSAQITHKEESLNPSLDLSQITQTSEKRCWEELTKALGRVFSLVEPAASKRGRGGAFILSPKN